MSPFFTESLSGSLVLSRVGRDEARTQVQENVDVLTIKIIKNE